MTLSTDMQEKGQENDTLDCKANDILRHVYSGNTKIVKNALAAGYDVGSANRKGGTLLHAAIHGGNKDMMMMLIEYGASVNVKSACGQTPLVTAANYNHHDLIPILLEAGAETDHRDMFGKTALHYMCQDQYCDTNALKLILPRCLNIDPVDNWDYTPICYAILVNNISVASLLIRNGADVAWKVHVDGCRMGLLQSAVNSESVGMVRLLLQNQSHRNVAKLEKQLSLLDEPDRSELLLLLKNTLTLKDMCRILLIRRLGNRLENSFPDGSLPSTLRDFLLK